MVQRSWSRRDLLKSAGAGVVAAGVAWVTENMFATLAVGMLTFWAVGAVL